jgi:hypothetical protein
MAEKLFDNGFNSTELTKINIEPHKVFAIKDDELHHIRLQVHEYLHSQDYDKCIFIKYTHKKQINPNAANNIFVDIEERFKNMLSLAELYSIMSDYFEIDYIELYNLFAPGLQRKLKLELVQNTSYSMNELSTTKANDGYFMPGI